MAQAQEKAATSSGIDPLIEKYKRRIEKLKADRGTLNSHLEEIAEVIYPNAQGFISRRTKGEKRTFRIYDETGITANRLMAAGLHSMATNPSSKWFSLRVLADKSINEAERVKAWRSQVEDILYEEMYAPGSGLITTLIEFYLGLGAFGTSAFFIGETSRGSMMFQSRALAECYVAENADGVIDILIREYPQTVRQVVETPGWTASDKVRALYAQGKFDDEVRICHYVGPREKRDPTKSDPDNMAWHSCYFEMETCHRLQEGGFPEFPYVVARWEKAAGELYGRSAGMEALPAVKMLQLTEAEAIRVMQKMANPVRYFRDDGVTGAIRSIPGATNYWRGNPHEGVMLEPTSDKVPQVLEWQESIRNRVRTIFNNDTLQIVDQREMTLGEARMRKTERMRLMGPNIGRLDAEMLGPMIERVYGILDRRGKIPPSPDEMEGKPITVEFVSPLAAIQKQEQLSGIVDTANYMTLFGEPGLLALAKRVNFDRMVKGVWEINSNDPSWLNTDDEQAAIAQQEQNAQNAQNAVPAADAASKGAGAIQQLADAGTKGLDVNELVRRVSTGAQAANGRAA